MNFNDHAICCALVPSRTLETSMSMHRELAVPHGGHMLLPENVRLIVKKKKKKRESIANKRLKPSQMKMFLKSNEWSI